MPKGGEGGGGGGASLLPRWGDGGLLLYPDGGPGCGETINGTRICELRVGHTKWLPDVLLRHSVDIKVLMAGGCPAVAARW